MTADAVTNTFPYATEESSTLQKTKTNLYIKVPRIKENSLIQPMFIKHLLHFPDTILGTENTVVNKTSPCSGGVCILV